MYKYIILSPLICGCVTWETVGVTSTKTFNNHIDEVNQFKDDALKPVEQIGLATVELANENISEAKSESDDEKLVRSVATRTKAEIALGEIRELEKSSFSKAPEVEFDFDIMHILTGLLGGMGGVGGVLALLLPKLNRIKEKAKEYAQSEHVNDISQDKDLK